MSVFGSAVACFVRDGSGEGFPEKGEVMCEVLRAHRAVMLTSYWL